MECQKNEVFEDASNKVKNCGNNTNNSEEHKKANGKKKMKKKIKRNKSSRSRSASNIRNMNRFVPRVCRQLKERKSYLVWAAVACLGASALSDLVKEVAAIQACGGQKTADGGRFRHGGGVLWNILKQRDPGAYTEIMRRGREFEKQFKLPLNIPPEPVKKTEPCIGKITSMLKKLTTSDADPVEEQRYKHVEERYNRLRVPVSYDDLVGHES